MIGLFLSFAAIGVLLSERTRVYAKPDLQHALPVLSVRQHLQHRVEPMQSPRRRPRVPHRSGRYGGACPAQGPRQPARCVDLSVVGQQPQARAGPAERRVQLFVQRFRLEPRSAQLGGIP